jgi:cullin 3
LLQSFEEFVNKQGRSPEYVSLYIDELLRNKKQEISDADVELKMDKVMPLFRSVGQATEFDGVLVGCRTTHAGGMALGNL